MSKKKNALIAGATTVAAIAAAGVNASADQITVKKGDTVWGLAQENNTTVDQIVADNDLANKDLIVSGSTLTVNEASTEATTTETTTSADTTTSTQNADGTVTVAAGDTLYAIATRYNVSVSTLIANNGGSTIIVPGQTLSLTATAASTTAAPAATAPAATTTAKTTTSSNYVSSAVTNGSWLSVSKSILGIPYVWGGSSTSGFDCSGFVSYVRAHSGQSNLGRTSYQQAATLRAQGSQPKSLSEAQPGDLLFWGGVGSEYHVEIYLGGGQSIGATKPGDVSSIHAVWGNPVAYSA